MSLINDALKRARQAQHQKPAAPAPAPQLRPVEAAPRRSANPGMLAPAALIVLAAGLAVIIWLLLRPGSPRTLPATTAAATSPAPASPGNSAAPNSIPTPASAPLPVAEAATPRAAVPAPAISTPGIVAPTAPAAAQEQIAAPAGTSAVATNPASPAVVASEPPSPPPVPRLQGIFYRPDRAAAVLDNKTVFVGDRIGGFDVIAIDRQSVTVARAGRTNVLSLAE